MDTWKKLYGMVWLNFTALMLIFCKSGEFCAWAHIALGTLIVLLAWHNRQALMATACPARLKRIAGVMIFMGLMAAASGAGLKFAQGSTLITTLWVCHVVAAMALFTQSASVATAFDMWQDKEFLPQTVGPS